MNVLETILAIFIGFMFLAFIGFGMMAFLNRNKQMPELTEDEIREYDEFVKEYLKKKESRKKKKS